MIVTSGGRANGRCPQNASVARAAPISGRREPPPHRKIRPGSRSPPEQLLHDQLDARGPDPDVIADDGRQGISRLAGESSGVVHLDRLGAREGQVQPVRDALGEGAAAEREHARALDPAVAHERDVRGPAADVHEQGPGLADLVAAQDAGDRVGLGHDLQQLEVQL